MIRKNRTIVFISPHLLKSWFHVTIHNKDRMNAILEVFVIHHGVDPRMSRLDRSKIANFAFIPPCPVVHISSHSFQSWTVLPTYARTCQLERTSFQPFAHVTAKRAAKCARGRKFAIWSRLAICCYVLRGSKSQSCFFVLAQQRSCDSRSNEKSSDQFGTRSSRTTKYRYHT